MKTITTELTERRTIISRRQIVIEVPEGVVTETHYGELYVLEPEQPLSNARTWLSLESALARGVVKMQAPSDSPYIAQEEA